MIRKVLHNYELAEAKGHLPSGTAVKATYATIMEAGCTAFHKSFYGNAEWARATNDIRANNLAYEEAMTLAEAFLSDVTKPCRSLREAQTSTDFPLILANIRSNMVRETLMPVNTTTLWDFAEPRIATDFKIMKTYKVLPAEELALRPEGEDVEITKIEMTGDGYAVANYERGVDFTWEMWKNDDLSIFTRGLKNLGSAARRTRMKVLLRAIATLPRTTLGTAGGPDITRIAALVDALAAVVDATSGDNLGLSLTDIFYPVKWKITATEALKSEYVIGPTAGKNPSKNVVFGIAEPHEERLMASVLGNDWLGWDNTVPFVERAVLDDFQGGPLTYTKTPDVNEHPDQGSFDNHSLSVKVGDAVGGKVIETAGVVRVKGD